MTQPSNTTPENATLISPDIVAPHTRQESVPDHSAYIRGMIARWRLCWLLTNAKKVKRSYFDGNDDVVPPKDITSDSSWSKHESTNDLRDGSIETKVKYPNGSTTRTILRADATSIVMSLSVDGSQVSYFSLADPKLYPINEHTGKRPSSGAHTNH